MMNKLMATTAASLFLLSGMAFAQTADLDAKQANLDELNSQLEAAQLSAQDHARADQLNREAFSQQNQEISEQEHRNNIARYNHQIALENQRADRQITELTRIDSLIKEIADKSETLRVARIEEFTNRNTAETQQIEELKNQRIATLQAQIDQQQQELDALRAKEEAAQVQAQSDANNKRTLGQIIGDGIDNNLQ